MTDRCACRRPGGWYMHVDHCPRHGDVDAILTRERYVDRRGQIWHYGGGVWSAYGRPIPGHFQLRTPDQMRLKIVREQHREVCPGLRDCDDHPVAVVTMHWPRWPQSWLYATDGANTQYEEHPTFGAALGAARHMTGETP